jgi:hypothetical protein
MTSNEIAETKTRARIERLYEAFAHHDLEMLREVVTSRKGRCPAPTRWHRYFRTSLPLFLT